MIINVTLKPFISASNWVCSVKKANFISGGSFLFHPKLNPIIQVKIVKRWKKKICKCKEIKLLSPGGNIWLKCAKSTKWVKESLQKGTSRLFSALAIIRLVQWFFFLIGPSEIPGIPYYRRGLCVMKRKNHFTVTVCLHNDTPCILWCHLKDF